MAGGGRYNAAMKPVQLGRVARAYGISIGIWSVYSLLAVWQFHEGYHSFNIYPPFVDMLILAEVRGFTFALLTPPIFYIVARYSVGGKHPIQSLVAYLLGVVPFMACFAIIRWALFPTFDVTTHTFYPRSIGNLMWLLHGDNAPQVFTAYIGIVVAAHAYGYFAKFRRQEVDKYAFEQALAVSELQVLKMQLHPHFLFNTLNGISALIDTDGTIARAMVVKLSRLLRMALDYGSSDLIPLREELGFAGEYLDLEKMRLGDRLNVEWCIESDTGSMLVPQMILQPLIENAIRHGIACCRGGGWLEITSRRAADELELQIRNSVGGRSARGTGVGLRNTEARLRYLYSDDAILSFVLSHNETATATVRLPALRSNEGSPGPSIPPAADNIKSVKVEYARPDRG
jgi:two-component system LytT family sensor kinase